MDPIIRPLRDPDAAAYARLRRRALQAEPLAFSASQHDDLASSAHDVRAYLRRMPDATILGAFQREPARLIGAVGLFRDRHQKSAHRAHIWGMYVEADARGRGIGGQLLEAAIAQARALPGIARIELSVTSAAPAARRLYERAGFQIWGSEPEALRHGGCSVVEHHLTLALDSDVHGTAGPAAGGAVTSPGPTVLAISGSLRALSAHTELLRAAARLAPPPLSVNLYGGLGELPLFNPELDLSVPPPAVAAFRAQVDAADALLIASPEYAHGVPGALKNALDWLVSGIEIAGKPVGLLNGSAHARHADEALREILTTLATHVDPDARVTVAVSGRRLAADAIVADATLAAVLRRALEALAAAIARRRNARAHELSG